MGDSIFRRSDGVWLNEPERWTAQGDRLEMVTDRATDFWRETHYGFNRDSGHFLAFPAADIGLMRAMAAADGQRPSPAQLLSRAERWRPWRAYAAQHLWAADGGATVRHPLASR